MMGRHTAPLDAPRSDGTLAHVTLGEVSIVRHTGGKEQSSHNQCSKVLEQTRDD